MARIRKAIIPVGGCGSRMATVTNNGRVPKELLLLGGLPILAYTIRECFNAGIKELMLVFNPNYPQTHDMVERIMYDYKDDMKWCYTYQEERLGFGHAISLCDSFIDRPVGIVLPDDLITPMAGESYGIGYLSGIYSGAACCMVEEVKDVTKYGIVESDIDEGFGVVNNIIEKPSIDKAPGNTGIIGRYIIDERILRFLHYNYMDFTVSFKQYCPFLMAVENKGTRFDCGSPEGYSKAVNFVNREIEIGENRICLS